MCASKMAFSDPLLSAHFKLGLKLIERPGILIENITMLENNKKPSPQFLLFLKTVINSLMNNIYF
jgi:hypothetical protein